MINVSFTQDELNALAALIDAGVKAIGINSVKPAAAIIVKLEAAATAAQSVEGSEGGATSDA